MSSLLIAYHELPDRTPDRIAFDAATGRLSGISQDGVDYSGEVTPVAVRFRVGVPLSVVLVAGTRQHVGSMFFDGAPGLLARSEWQRERIMAVPRGLVPIWLRFEV